MKIRTAIRLSVAIALFTILGCSKHRERCWDCEITQMPGTKVEVCNNSNTAPTIWTDGVGNNAAVSNCKKK